jgi:hypothetical protein
MLSTLLQPGRSVCIIMEPKGRHQYIAMAAWLLAATLGQTLLDLQGYLPSLKVHRAQQHSRDILDAWLR